MKKMKYSTKITVLVSAAILCVSAMLAFILWSNGYVEQSFSELAMDNLTSAINTRLSETESAIKQLRFNLSASEKLVSVLPEEELSLYLNELSASSQNCEYFYISQEQASAGETGIFDKDKLLKGEQEFTDIKTLENKSVFGISAPILQNGNFVGAICIKVKAKILLDTLQDKAYADCYILKTNGDFVNIGNVSSPTVNLFSTLSGRNDIAQGDLQKIKENLSEKKSVAVAIRIKGDKYFFSSLRLSVNDWNIVGFSSYGGITEYYKNILTSTNLTTISLIVLSVAGTALAVAVFSAQNKNLKIQTLKYANLEKFSDTVLYQYDYRNDVITWSENALKLIKLDAAVLKNYRKNGIRATFVHPDDNEYIGVFFNQRPDDGEIVKSRPVRVLGYDGYNWAEIQYCATYDVKGAYTGYVGKVTDVTAVIDRERILREKAHTDGMSGLLNAEGFNNAVQELLDAGKSGVMFQLDIDNFKGINDNFGHIVGNGVIHCVGELLRGISFEKDTVGRTGGDEFSLFMCEHTDKKSAENKAKELLKTISEWDFADTGLKITFSIGIACVENGNMELSELYEHADIAMYEAKRRGKNKYFFYCEVLKT